MLWSSGSYVLAHLTSCLAYRGTLIAGKRYSARDYATAAVVALGCSSFALSGGATTVRETVSSNQGAALLLGYLSFDGFTSTFQVQLQEQHAVQLASTQSGSSQSCLTHCDGGVDMLTSLSSVICCCRVQPCCQMPMLTAM